MHINIRIYEYDSVPLVFLNIHCWSLVLTKAVLYSTTIFLIHRENIPTVLNYTVCLVKSCNNVTALLGFQSRKYAVKATQAFSKIKMLKQGLVMQGLHDYCRCFMYIALIMQINVYFKFLKDLINSDSIYSKNKWPKVQKAHSDGKCAFGYTLR